MSLSELMQVEVESVAKNCTIVDVLCIISASLNWHKGRLFAIQMACMMRRVTL